MTQMTMRPILTSALLITTLAVRGAEAPPELLFSEDFDGPEWAQGIAPEWEHYSEVRTVEPSSERRNSGSRSLKLSDADPRRPVGLRSPRIPVTGGASVWAQCNYFGAHGNNAALYVEFWGPLREGIAERLAATSFHCAGTGTWNRVTARCTAPADAVTATVHLNSYSGNLTVGYYDDIRFGTEISRTLERRAYPPAPVVHPCGLYKPDDIARARANIERHAWARRVLEDFREKADFWMSCADERLPYWIPELTPFRVVDCPACGAGWRFAWKNSGPDRLDCQKCGFSWPHADYRETESEDFVDPLGITQTIPYYKGTPSTEYGADRKEVYRLSGRLRYHRINRLISLGNLGKVYALTGETDYAEKVRKVLLRLAEAYPHYLPHDWNRVYPDYSNLQSGKLSGWKLHDAGFFIQLATAYDLTYNSGVYSEQDKIAIEEGCFREFARLMIATSPRGCCINDGPTAMSAGALAGLMLGEHKAIEWAVEPPDGFIGFLEEYFSRDGHWYEASASYEGMTLGSLYVTPEALRGYSDPPGYTAKDRYDNLDLFSHPLMRKILVASAAERMPDGNLPATNDSTFGARYPRQRAEQQAFWYPSPESLALLAWAYDGNPADEGNEYSLFRRPPDLDFNTIEAATPSSESTVSPGPGLAILRTGDRSADAALLLDFGPYGGGHGHPDKLNVVYYDFGRELVTDLGYLGWGHPNHPWIRSTAAHNLVLVDGRAQARIPGRLDGFAHAPGIHAVIASAPGIYGPTVELYQRTAVLIDRGPGQRFVVDHFQIRGGTRHQYLFHGDGPELDWGDLSLQEAAAADLGEANAGWAHVDSVRRGRTSETIRLTWRDPETPEISTRLWMLPQADTVLWTCRAPGLRQRSTPFDARDLLKVAIERPGPETAFLGVFEAIRGDSGIAAVRPLQVQSQAGHAAGIEIHSSAYRDIVVVADAEGAAAPLTLPDYPHVRFQGRLGVISLHDDHLERLWMLGGSHLQWNDQVLRATPGYSGRIIAVDQDAFTFRVDTPLPPENIRTGAYLCVDLRPDGAYRVSHLEPSDMGTLVHLAGDPIITAAAGDTWTLVTSADMDTRDGIAPGAR